MNMVWFKYPRTIVLGTAMPPKGLDIVEHESRRIRQL